MALENVSLNVSAAAGRDDYLKSRFGLRENKHRVYSAGFDAAPAERVTLSALYTFEWYRGLSRSRDASSLDDMLDEARDWALYTTDRVHTVFTNVDVKGIAEKVDVGFSLDVSRARAAYDYRLPPVSSLRDGLNPLPANRSELTRGTVDALYALTPRIGIGVTYWREQFRVADFTLDEASTPSLNLANSLLLGYLYRPYTANTFWGRVVYRW
jgi:hypothetical protein